MTDPPRNPDTRDDTPVEPDRKATTGTSLWQKVVGIIGLFVILWIGNQIFGQFTGRGHGPGGMRHGPGQDAPPAEIQERETDTEAGGNHAPPRRRSGGAQ